MEQAKQTLSSQYPSYFGAKGPFAWLIDRIDRIISAPQQAIQSGANPIQVLLSPFSAFVGSVVAENITNILVGLSGAYQWGIELTMLLSAYLGPLAVGGSLLPYGAKPLLAWLTGYFSVGIAKLGFNIISGFAAELIANSRSDQPLFFLSGLRQKLGPNVAQTGFVSSKYVTIKSKPIKKAERHSCSEGF
ncbi:hypothetical protein [Dendronalium sp. ChiSLP03b]|uniref:hypothetical protein n=1 Tax=Dendronalium sp. ChiSLP03b TaxID=3075381 RepID=UPI002AD2A7CF|nr:hypothetical protein [Dendronalium sp. ChiSLP03b]MDZ8206533.1 hypothetical protein [Dendronalium sp. ChiSLP03b]